MFLSVEWAKRWLPAIFLLLSLFLPWWALIRSYEFYEYRLELYLSFPWEPNVEILNVNNELVVGYDVTTNEIPYLYFVSALIVLGGLCGLSSKRRTRSLGGLLGIAGLISYVILVFPKSSSLGFIYPKFPYLGMEYYESPPYKDLSPPYKDSRMWFLSVGFYLALIGSIMLLLPLIRTLTVRLRKQLRSYGSNATLLLSAILVGILIFGGIYFVQSVLSEPYSQIEFQTIEKGFFSGHKKAAYYVIENEDEWADIWNQHQRFRWPKIPPPEVNFSETMIIAVFMGEFNTGGYGIEIKNILDMNESVLVKIEKTYPGRRCVVTLAVTEPFHIVRVERIEKKIEFYTYERIYECP